MRFYSLNRVDLGTGRCAVTPVLSKAGPETLDTIWSHWCRLGIPEHQQVALNSKFSIPTLFLLHAFLLREKGTDNQLNNATDNLLLCFQSTVHDVVALPVVTYVMAPET